ncbi:MAG TPA: hypothetical protein VMU48_02945 [Terracidiphilus sp.]|nr:hypothetical protein [Terracidiphilus sp.]
MSGIQFAIRRPKVASFSSVVIDALPFLVGLFTLGRIVWRFPSLRLQAAIFFAVLVLTLLYQMRRIHRVYAAAHPLALRDENDVLARTLSELMRTFRWGGLIVMLLSLGVLWTWTHLH